MTIARETTVAELAANQPATIAVFQKHQIDFCCGGKRPIADACAEQGVDVTKLLLDLQEAVANAPDDDPAWSGATVAQLIAHIQERYHNTLRRELPRLAQMMDKVLSRHGDHHGETLQPLHATFERLRAELLEHIDKEDAMLFPAILNLQTSGATGASAMPPAWISQPIHRMELEHETAGAALARLRELTNGYAPPADACPTYRGLYYGLSELERDMHTHVHLENHVLFPKAERIARALTTP